MKTFPSLIVALLLPISLSIVEASLEETCKKVAQDHPGIDYNFCMTSLQVVPESCNDDAPGLAFIAANLARANVTHNLEKAKELLNNKNVSEESKSVLRTCVEVYEVSIHNFKKAIEAIKINDRVSICYLLGKALSYVHICINTWEEGNENSIMAKEEEDADKIGYLALEIAGSYIH